MSSVVQITYDNAGTPLDITNDVIFEDASFEYQMNAIPGTFSFRVRDPNQTHAFITGREIRLYIDGVPMFGGYIQRIGSTFPFPADDTSSPTTYTKRIWRLEGVDYNILFDNRMLRMPSNYLGHIPDETGYAKETMDGWVLRKMLADFCDFPSGFDITTRIDDIGPVIPTYEETEEETFFYQQQGTKIREQFQERAARSGAVFYIGPEKAVHYHAFENVYKRWGFSDNPNNNAITGTASDYVEPIATAGFQEVSVTEDGTLLINDAMVWGGGAPASDTVVFARYQDAVDGVVEVADRVYAQTGNPIPANSIAIHGRWQFAETRFNDINILDLAKNRAEEIIYGPTGTDRLGQAKGLRYPQWQCEFQWFAHDVPTIAGVPDHVKAGEIVKVELQTFDMVGDDQFYGAKFLPCRTLRINFPSLDETGGTYVHFSGEFSLQYTDPIALWQTILGRPSSPYTVNVITGVSNASTSTSYGDYGSFYAYEAADGARTVFSMVLADGTTRVAYIANTLIVYVNGLAQVRGTGYFETSPSTGEFTMGFAPEAGAQILAICRTMGSSNMSVATVTSGNTRVVSSIPALLTQLADNSVSEIVVSDGTYHVSGASYQQADSLWIGSQFAGRTNPVIVRAATTGNVTFDGGGAADWIGLYFGGGAHHQTWQGFRFANGKPTQTGVIYLGGGAAPHHITLHDISIANTVTSVSTGLGDHGIYISQSIGGVHDVLVDGYTVDGSGGLDSAIHFYHSGVGEPNAWNVTVRNMAVTGTDQAVVLWDSTLSNIVIEDSTITNATSIAVRYEDGGTVTLRRVTSTGSGSAGFYSSLGSNPPGVTFDNCNFG